MNAPDRLPPDAWWLGVRAWPRFHDRALQLTLRQRLGVHWYANLRMLRSARAIVGFTVISFLPMPLLLIAIGVLARGISPSPATSPAPMLASALALLGLYLWAQHFAFMVAMKRHYAPFVLAELWQRGQPVCPACGHLLGPNPPPACPECGSALRGLR